MIYHVHIGLAKTKIKSCSTFSRSLMICFQFLRFVRKMLLLCFRWGRGRGEQIYMVLIEKCFFSVQAPFTLFFLFFFYNNDNRFPLHTHTRARAPARTHTHTLTHTHTHTHIHTHTHNTHTHTHTTFPLFTPSIWYISDVLKPLIFKQEKREER